MLEEADSSEELEAKAPGDLVGKTIGHYLVERKLGEGGMGVVYEAVHTSIGQRVAIKFLHGKLGRDRKALQRFINEARAIGIVQHPGLVKVHDYQQLPDGTAYLVMELLQGESLADRLEPLHSSGERLPLITTVALAQQVASVLAAAHRRGIVHCDLKPENVFLTKDPAISGGERVKILDFGIAKFLAGTDGKTTTVGLILGTPRYMSPEQCDGRDKIDDRTDVYALGVMLFEMLAGKPPFIAETSMALMRQHICREPPPLSAQAPVPQGLHDLVHQMLAKEPGQRPTMSDVESRLSDASTMRVTSRKRSRILIGAISSVSVLIVGLLVMWRSSGTMVRRPEPPVAASANRQAPSAPPIVPPPVLSQPVPSSPAPPVTLEQSERPALPPPQATTHKKKRSAVDAGAKSVGDAKTGQEKGARTDPAQAPNPFSVPIAR